jgi:hypothetical protein
MGTQERYAPAIFRILEGVDATVPYQTGVASTARPSIAVNPEEPRTLNFNLVLGVRSSLTVYRQRPRGRTVVLQRRARSTA